VEEENQGSNWLAQSFSEKKLFWLQCSHTKEQLLHIKKTFKEICISNQSAHKPKCHKTNFVRRFSQFLPVSNGTELQFPSGDSMALNTAPQSFSVKY